MIVHASIFSFLVPVFDASVCNSTSRAAIQVLPLTPFQLDEKLTNAQQHLAFVAGGQGYRMSLQ